MDRLSMITQDINFFYRCGITSDYELEQVESEINLIRSLKNKGLIPPMIADELIKKGEDAIERRYSYLEERESLGNNWW